jgi:hypothetical protein
MHIAIQYPNDGDEIRSTIANSPATASIEIPPHVFAGVKFPLSIVATPSALRARYRIIDAPNPLLVATANEGDGFCDSNELCAEIVLEEGAYSVRADVQFPTITKPFATTINVEPPPATQANATPSTSPTGGAVSLSINAVSPSPDSVNYVLHHDDDSTENVGSSAIGPDFTAAWIVTQAAGGYRINAELVYGSVVAITDLIDFTIT